MKDFNLGEAILLFFQAYALPIALGTLAFALAFGIPRLMRRSAETTVGPAAAAPAQLGGLRRFWRTLLQIFGNWQLALLAATALILSLASGWTTWDGMRNFTREPVLSLMATFGIQGVMLITAWLIGETFARGATGETERDRSVSGRERAMETAQSSFPLLIGAILLGLIVGAASYLFSLSEFQELSAMYGRGLTWTAMGLASFLFVAFVLILFSKTDILGNYAQGARVILANLHLWVMFLACMATSVFFSFDSLFTSIFPQEERVRAAEIRAINQVASTVADIGGLIQKRQLEESEKLFSLPAWAAYEKQLDAVTKVAEKAPALIREQITREIEEQKARVAALEEKRATAQGGQAGLATRKATLTEELSRLQGQRPTEAAEAQTDKAKVAELERLSAEQRVKTAAEEKGVEGSGKVGRGQFYRASKAEEDKLGDQLKIARDRLRNSDGRLTATDRRLSSIKAELAQIDGDLAKLKGEAETAGQLIGVAQTNKKADAAQKFDPAAGVGALERERQAFRQKPEQATLANIQNACGSLLSAAGKVPSLHEDAARIDCDPKEASEAANRVFALNTGAIAFASHCVGGDKLPETGGTSALLTFGRRCLQDSGLGSRDSAAVGSRLAAVDLNRDDKAHRFVVTWNAFLDGNRLAYLALAIAIAIDSLVFMSGLFGANAIASPLSGTPEAKRRSVQDLEKVIYSALRPEPVNAADLAVNLMEPVRLSQYPGFTVFVDLNPIANDQQRFAVRKVLTAGSGLGLVSHVGEYPSIYLIRRELHEYLLKVSGDEHDRGRRPDPAFAVPQLDPSASMSRLFLAHYTRMSAAPRAMSAPTTPQAWLPGDGAMDVTPHAGRLPYAPAPQALPPRAPASPSSWSRPDAHDKPPALLGQAANDFGARGVSARLGNRASSLKARIDSAAPSANAAPISQADLLVQFLEPLGLTRADYDTLASSELDKQITNATYALVELAKSDNILRERLSAIDEHMKESINVIRRRHPGSEALANHLDYNREALVLFGTQGYASVINMLIAQMEGPSGEGKLSLAEDRRYQHLKHHQGELHRLWRVNPRSAADWENLTNTIRSLAQALAQLQATEHDRQRTPQTGGVRYLGEPGHG